MSSSSTVRPGDVLASKYRVERVLGSGGMGYVVAARHLQLDQLVAMKFLKRGQGTLDETEATGRFLREAKAVVKLKDEHVARVFDVGTLESGEPFIVMEYLDGSDLSAMSKARTTMPVTEAVEYIMQACEALAEAHSLGIVHRDVKLANLFVTRGAAGAPLVKVLDFGISKVNPFGEAEQEMTRTATMLGSPRFMSPEQMRDPRNVDARSDLWSLGVCLYRLVGGKPPFEADTLGRLLTMVMHEQPEPLAAVRADLPQGFSETVMHCLEKDPNARFANVAELAYALVPFAVDPVRARGVADRIAATLSVAAMPRSFEIPAVVPSRPSAPPGHIDTGTAAPWAGTHGGSKRDSSRAGIVWAAVALAGVLVAGGLFAKVRHDRAADAAAAAAKAPEAPSPPSLVNDSPPAMPALTAPAAMTGDAPTPPGTGTGASISKPPRSTPEAKPRGGFVPARRPEAAPKARPASPAGGDGIPSTRD
ncbi:MAG: serine/threonine protein kinase [Deltaproteobacteria bacterium]|nr:serine/threonine protein kinase [Deltaproteobacteria bacterium]